MTSDPNRYLKELDLYPASNPDDESKITKAFETALDTRKFEIQLYWQRAAYFWAFTAAALTGFVAIQAIKGSEVTDALSLLIATVGLFAATAWHQVNKGSKAWQENWENHVDYLQKHVVGNLFQVVLLKDSTKLFSVSRINSHISRSMILLWLALVTVFGILVWEKAGFPELEFLSTELLKAETPGSIIGDVKPSISIAVENPTVTVKFDEQTAKHNNLDITALIIAFFGSFWSLLLWSGCLGSSSESTQRRIRDYNSLDPRSYNPGCCERSTNGIASFWQKLGCDGRLISVLVFGIPWVIGTVKLVDAALSYLS
ncbi:hypothetical protein SAMN04488518_103352 [Pseudovibrio ascidiaceicola]|uniref:SMODS and SLOG-associating 2TM effector domain-containing protein n=1 Tax=Pseudovibrio ascidiaceicola TaxID=285279 RepID=A0A1I3Y4G5_9HYPH|nr:hypothetical protein [Pseudovibrio ascidiaceicola]SFK26748.1 hypothetical protein SAMN04488518_103352 [Pseudovibrio ascidiaceicola]